MAFGTHTVEVTTSGNAPRTIVRAGSNELVSDAPASQGGAGSGLSPSELLLAAVAGCKSMTVQMYASRKGWALTRVAVRATDEPRESEGSRVVIRCTLALEGSLSSEQRARLLEIAGRCPVSRLVASGTEIQDALGGAAD